MLNIYSINVTSSAYYLQSFISRWRPHMGYSLTFKRLFLAPLCQMSSFHKHLDLAHAQQQQKDSDVTDAILKICCCFLRVAVAIFLFPAGLRE